MAKKQQSECPLEQDDEVQALCKSSGETLTGYVRAVDEDSETGEILAHCAFDRTPRPAKAAAQAGGADVEAQRAAIAKIQTDANAQAIRMRSGQEKAQSKGQDR